MEKKQTIITLICIAVLLIGVATFIILSGLITMDSNYVLLEINPRIEFVTDRNYIVTSYTPLNVEAKELAVQETFVGLNVDEAVVKFVDLCTRANYIDVESSDNAIKLTVVDGLTQALDTHIVESVHSYLKKNEILCTLIENPSDLNSYKSARKHNIGNLNKYKLIESIIENNYSTMSYDELKNMSEDDLIAIVKVSHPVSHEYTEEELTNKVKLLDFNRERYDSHKEKINDSTQREFAKLYEEHQKNHSIEYKNNFDKMYEEWYKSKQYLT